MIFDVSGPTPKNHKAAHTMSAWHQSRAVVSFSLFVSCFLNLICQSPTIINHGNTSAEIEESSDDESLEDVRRSTGEKIKVHFSKIKHHEISQKLYALDQHAVKILHPTSFSKCFRILFLF